MAMYQQAVGCYFPSHDVSSNMALLFVSAVSFYYEGVFILPHVLAHCTLNAWHIGIS